MSQRDTKSPMKLTFQKASHQRPVQQSEHWTAVFAIVKKRAHANNHERSLNSAEQASEHTFSCKNNICPKIKGAAILL
jgi:hypothetical protein